MKRIFLTMIILLTGFYVSLAQSESSIETIQKFSKFYKDQQIDSAFTLFSPKVQAALKIEGTKQLFAQIKSQLGEIVRSRAIGTPVNEIQEYRLTFERPLIDLALMINNKLIVGILQKAVEKDKGDIADLESPDNFTVNNSFGALYGTLVIPNKQTEKIPVVIFISGSGPTDRNMNQGNLIRTNSFLLLANSLAANGIASLRYDKRGVGKSEGALKSNNIELNDYVNDAELFIKKLKADSRFSKIIILGHSEGSTIGILTAKKTKVNALISLCGPSSDLGTILRKQLKTLPDSNYTIASKILDTLQTGKLIHQKISSPTLVALFNPVVQPYLISSMKYQPSIELKKLTIPIFILGGTEDQQIGIENTERLAKSNPKSQLLLIKGMNHVLKSTTGKTTESYTNPDLPLHGGLVSSITKFINNLPNN
ncbi:alpha/beta hydrolase [Pedobacter cryoconitis]|uniref:Serine aminopeptidase S33 domain-containing protein n=1 Tax=Pedobacter cryoconitis TaxID=188932 RepID=A0A327RSA1_9SPHI|nr:alpha/beta fold hydrolase [Pedobacter cryoconitis]RAJ19876.1 hypothetical protein LY11_05263 [Pedobacter cryoconitis]